MTSDNTRRNPGTPLRKIIAYSTGEGATSLTMNGIAAFAMLYYVQVLGLNSKWAGLALSVSMLWDAISDPIMGHITDNTRSRFGRRRVCCRRALPGRCLRQSRCWVRQPFLSLLWSLPSFKRCTGRGAACWLRWPHP